MTGIVTDLMARDLFNIAGVPYGGTAFTIPNGFVRVDLAELGITQIPDKITPEVYRQEGTNNYIISYRGSNLPGFDENYRDLRTDYQITIGEQPEAFSQAYDFFLQVQAGVELLHPGETGSFATVGHSLGGALSLYVAARAQYDTGQLIEGVGINAPAFRADEIPSSFDSYYANSLFNIVTPGDAVSAVTSFNAESRGMIMPAERAYIFYGPTGASTDSACTYNPNLLGIDGRPLSQTAQLVRCFGLVLESHDLKRIISEMEGDPYFVGDEDNRTIGEVVDASRSNPRINPGDKGLLDIYNERGYMSPVILSLFRTFLLPYGDFDPSNITFTENDDGTGTIGIAVGPWTLVFGVDETGNLANFGQSHETGGEVYLGTSVLHWTASNISATLVNSMVPANS